MFLWVCSRRGSIILACIIATAQVVAQTPDAAASPRIGNKNGVWSLPLRYWSHQYVFEERDSFVFHVKVVSLGTARQAKAENASRPFLQEGTLGVLELLNGDTTKYPELLQVKSLLVEGCNGLKVGDRVVVFVDSEPYEGGYVINYHQDASSILGVCLPSKDPKFGKDEQEKFLKMLRDKQEDIERMKIEDLRLWRQIDPNGVSAALIRGIESGKLKWIVE